MEGFELRSLCLYNKPLPLNHLPDTIVFNFYKVICFYMYECLSVTGDCEGWKRVDPLELKPWTVVRCGYWKRDLGPLQEQ